MKNPKLTFLFALSCAALPCFGQFHVTPATVEMAEGGSVNLLAIASGQDRFLMRQPPGFTCRVDPQNKSLLFRSADEKTAISFQVTTNFPGQLPSVETLRARVMEQTPGAGILQSSVCSTGYKAAQFFDLVRTVRDGMSVRFRHVYVPCPKGTVEFVFATDSEDFERQRFVLNGLLNSFHCESAAAGALVRQQGLSHASRVREGRAPRAPL
jgi:hypothetical protein